MPTLSLHGLLTTDNLAALFTLTVLEIVLGVDNIIFIAILVGRLPQAQRDKARLIGLFLAMFMRIALLFAITAVMWLDKFKLFTLPWAGDAHPHPAPPDNPAAAQALAEGVATLAAQPNIFTGKDAVLVLGGLFLVGKSVYEIHHKIEDAGEAGRHEVAATPRELADGVAGGYVGAKGKGFVSVIVQILLLDIVFSLDSVITAVGMSKVLPIMIAAVVISVGVMLVFSGYIARFVDRHPTIKMLALAFLILIGMMLVADGTGWHVPKGYIYFSMAFALGVEMLNILLKKKSKGGHKPPMTA
jgi:predicted tellurium resistance membrane protein TerC